MPQTKTLSSANSAAELEHSNALAQLESLLTNAPIGFAFFDKEHRYVRLNQALADINGIPLEYHIGKTVAELLPINAKLVDPIIERIKKTKKAVSDLEIKGETPKEPGKERFWLTSFYPVLDKDENVIFIGAVVNEITKRKQTELELIKQTDLFETLTSNATTGLFVMDDKQCCVFMNQAAEVITGMKIHEVLKSTKPLHDLIHHTHPDGQPYPIENCPIDRALPSRANTEGEDIFVRPDGTFYPVAFSASPIIELGKPIGTVIEVRDITTEKRAQEEQQRLIEISRERNLLLQINQSKDEFIGIASHQLRTPATAVKQYLNILLDGYAGELSDQQKKYQEIANDSNERQLSLVNDLLKTAQIDASNYKLKRRKQNIVPIINKVIKELDQVFKAQGQIIRTNGLETPLKPDIDATEIKLVLSNLLENASKYSYRDTTITLSLRKSRNQAVISIKDQGVGIDSDNFGKIFDKFSRVDNELSNTVSGTGLGLYWVRQIVQLHGGKIEVSSRPNTGSTFTIKLPL